MAAKNGRTGAIVLPHEQWELLKRLAYLRAMHGVQDRPSVSETLRYLIAEAEMQIHDEIAKLEGRP